MSITQNANRVRIESAAKNGTLGSQAGAAANEIVLPSVITTGNNGNLETSPVYRRRHICLRRGETNEESQMVRSVDVDGVTCTMYDNWDEAPASGDTYDVSYRLEDVATIAGCDFETDSRQWVMSKRLIVGITTTTFGYLGMSHGQILRLDDRGPTENAFQINAVGRFEIGTMKNEKPRRGALLIFTNDGDNEDVWQINGTARLYDFDLISARSPEGIKSLDVVVDAGADVEWADAEMHGIDAPFNRRRSKFKNVASVVYSTKADLENAPFWNGWLKSELDQSVFDALSSEATGVKVRLVIEDA